MNFSKDDLMSGLFGEMTANNFGQKLPEVDKREIIKIPLDLIDDLECVEHAYEKSLQMGLGIEELAEQIKAVGQQQPAVVREKSDGRYELIIGHRRKRACILARSQTLEAIVIDCTDDEAASISVDNLGQRPHTFPSEIAKAYKIQMEALKRQGKRMDILRKSEDDNLGQKLPEVNAREMIAQKYKISPRKVSNFLRLNELTDELLDLVDSSSIHLMVGVNLSYLTPKNQKEIVEILTKNPMIKISVETAEELKNTAKDIELSKVMIEAMVNPPIEEKEADFRTKVIKPVYKTALNGVAKYVKKLPPESIAKLSDSDAAELQKKLEETILKFIEEL